MFRRPRFIVTAAALLYVAVLAVVWELSTQRADARARSILESAETGYGSVINGEIEAALRNAGGAIISLFGGRCEPQSLERMQDLARTFNLDEINFVSRDGLVIASNVRSVIGADFRDTPQTLEFMALTNATITQVSQPFRRGVANPDMYCKYFGLAFPGHSGIIQLGISGERLRQNMYAYTEAEAERILESWHFSVVGWYVRAGGDPAYAPGAFFRRRHARTGEWMLGRYFEYSGYRYAAVLPESFCYAQRTSAFLTTAVTLGVLGALFVAFLVRIVITSGKLEAMHAQAEARGAADLALARTIQMSALPSAAEAYPEELALSVRAESLPAREVGGDFYDFYRMPGGRVAFLVADVSGKGIPAALFMMEAKNVLKVCLQTAADPAEALTEANARLCANNRAEMFVTAWVGVLDLATGVVTYVNAGHNRPFVRRIDGSVERIDGKGGRFLGMFEDATYRAHEVRLGHGDFIYLYTDGVTEAMNARREQFGEKRLRAELAAVSRPIREAIAAFVGEADRSDDLTGLAVRWNGVPVVTEAEFACDESSLGDAVAFLRGALAGLAPRSLAEILNAADEVTSNIVNYSGSARYTVAVERAPDRVRVRFLDGGRPYNPLSHVDPDVHAGIDERPVGGLGLVVVKRLMDRVTYIREGERNVLTLIKRTSAGDARDPLGFLI